MLHLAPVDLIPGDLGHNYRELLIWAMVIPADVINDDELSEDEPELLRHIRVFHIRSSAFGEQSFTVGEGKYRTAALLLYLSTIHGVGSFPLGIHDISFIKKYYPRHIIIDALHNEDTKHIALRSLLSKGHVEVKIEPAISC